jgi:hypothetical protein
VGGPLPGAIFLNILMENPWQHIPTKPTGSDINVAPGAHLSGAPNALLAHLFLSVTKRRASVKSLT